MPTLTETQCLATILDAVPGFQEQWDDHLAAHPGEPPDLAADLAELAAYAHALLARRQAGELHAVLAVAERLLRDGNPAVQEAVCGGFLESLAEPLAPDEPGLPLLLAALGPASRAYLQHWQRFSGRALPGL
ncbi:MAG: hypothetical protein CFE45_22110 [Burkholderiales bacterium PBB5]|nr:MAG: hypothetical protein CFE45_22110 [Burkholderiales bacterium PBB5]